MATTTADFIDRWFKNKEEWLVISTIVAQAAMEAGICTYCVRWIKENIGKQTITPPKERLPALVFKGDHSATLFVKTLAFIKDYNCGMENGVFYLSGLEFDMSNPDVICDLSHTFRELVIKDAPKKIKQQKDHDATD